MEKHNEYVWGENVYRLVCWTSETQKKVFKGEDIIIGESILRIQKDQKCLVGKLTDIELGANPCIHLEMPLSQKGRIYGHIEVTPMGIDLPIQYELVIEDDFSQFQLLNKYDMQEVAS